MEVGDQRWGRRPYRADQALGGTDSIREASFSSEGDDGGGSESLMEPSRGNVAIDRASGGAGTSARAWSPLMQPLAPGVLLRTSVPLRPQK